MMRSNYNTIEFSIFCLISLDLLPKTVRLLKARTPHNFCPIHTPETVRHTIQNAHHKIQIFIFIYQLR